MARLSNVSGAIPHPASIEVARRPQWNNRRSSLEVPGWGSASIEADNMDLYEGPRFPSVSHHQIHSLSEEAVPPISEGKHPSAERFGSDRGGGEVRHRSGGMQGQPAPSTSPTRSALFQGYGEACYSWARQDIRATPFFLQGGAMDFGSTADGAVPMGQLQGFKAMAGVGGPIAIDDDGGGRQEEGGKDEPSRVEIYVIGGVDENEEDDDAVLPAAVVEGREWELPEEDGEEGEEAIGVSGARRRGGRLNEGSTDRGLALCLGTLPGDAIWAARQRQGPSSLSSSANAPYGRVQASKLSLRLGRGQMAHLSVNVDQAAREAEARQNLAAGLAAAGRVEGATGAAVWSSRVGAMSLPRPSSGGSEGDLPLGGGSQRGSPEGARLHGVSSHADLHDKGDEGDAHSRKSWHSDSSQRGSMPRRPSTADMALQVTLGYRDEGDVVPRCSTLGVMARPCGYEVDNSEQSNEAARESSGSMAEPWAGAKAEPGYQMVQSQSTGGRFHGGGSPLTQPRPFATSASTGGIEAPRCSPLGPGELDEPPEDWKLSPHGGGFLGDGEAKPWGGRALSPHGAARVRAGMKKTGGTAERPRVGGEALIKPEGVVRIYSLPSKAKDPKLAALAAGSLRPSASLSPHRSSTQSPSDRVGASNCSGGRRSGPCSGDASPSHPQVASRLGPQGRKGVGAHGEDGPGGCTQGDAGAPRRIAPKDPSSAGRGRARATDRQPSLLPPLTPKKAAGKLHNTSSSEGLARDWGAKRPTVAGERSLQQGPKSGPKGSKLGQARIVSGDVGRPKPRLTRTFTWQESPAALETWAGQRHASNRHWGRGSEKQGALGGRRSVLEANTVSAVWQARRSAAARSRMMQKKELLMKLLAQEGQRMDPARQSVSRKEALMAVLTHLQRRTAERQKAKANARCAATAGVSRGGWGGAGRGVVSMRRMQRASSSPVEAEYIEEEDEVEEWDKFEEDDGVDKFASTEAWLEQLQPFAAGLGPEESAEAILGAWVRDEEGERLQGGRGETELHNGRKIPSESCGTPYHSDHNHDLAPYGRRPQAVLEKDKPEAMWARRHRVEEEEGHSEEEEEEVYEEDEDDEEMAVWDLLMEECSQDPDAFEQRLIQTAGREKYGCS